MNKSILIRKIQITFLAIFGSLFLLSNPLFAENGGIAIYREAVGGEDEDNQQVHDEPWDTIVFEDTEEFQLDAGEVNINLTTGGHYFIYYALNLKGNAGLGNSRTEHVGSIYSVSKDLTLGGFGHGYSRTNGSEQEIYVMSGAILNVSRSDDIKIQARNTSDITAQNVDRRANLSGVVLMKLDDDWGYIRLSEQTGGTSYDVAAFTDYTWDTIDEIDRGTFTYTAGNANITLREPGHYLLTYSIRVNTTPATSTVRKQTLTQVEIAGVPVPHCFSGSYTRGDQDGNSTMNGSNAGVCIVESTAVNQDLVVQIRQDATSLSDDISDVGGECNLAMVRLPDEAAFIRIHDSATGQSVDQDNVPTNFDSNDEVELPFEHDTALANDDLTVTSTGHYLFTSCVRTDRTVGVPNTTEDSRRYPHIHQWRKNGTTQAYGSFGAYNRGEQGSSDAMSSSNCGAIIFNDLAVDDVIEVAITDEGGFDLGDPFIQNNEVGLTGVHIDSLFVNVSGTTDLADDLTVRVAMNGYRQTEYTYTSGGSWDINVGKPLTKNAVITVWVDGVSEANESTAITRYDGTGDITGLELDQNILTIGNSDNRSLTIGALVHYDNDDDEDIMHLASTSNLTVDGASTYTGEMFRVLSGNTFTLDTTEEILSHDLSNDGTFTVTGRGRIEISGSWDNTGTFTAADGQVLMTSTNAETIKTDGDAFNDLYINDSLDLYYPLTEGGGSKTADNSGHGYTGTLENTEAADWEPTDIPSVNYKNNYSHQFNASDEGIRVLIPPKLGSAFSIAMWVNPDGTVGTNDNFIGVFDSTGWLFRTSTGDAQRLEFYDGAVNHTNGSDVLTTGTWQHIGVTFDGSAYRLYHNGTNVFTSAGGQANPQNEAAMTIGRLPASTAFSFPGFIDDVRIYSRTLATSEFVSLANGNTALSTSGSYALQDALDVNGDLYLNGGYLSANGNNINLAGDWKNFGGAFAEETQSVTFDGTGQEVPTSETFYNFTKSVSLADSLTLGKNTTQTVTNNLVLSGVNGNNLTVTSSTAGTRFGFDVTGASQVVSYLEVKDSQAGSNDIVAAFSFNRGGNDDAQASPHWIFPTTFYWVGNPGNTNDASSWAAGPSACGAGGAGIPDEDSDVVFAPDCTGNATVDAELTVAGFSMQSGYSGTITTNADLRVTGPFSMVQGTIDLDTNDNDVYFSGNVIKTGGTFTAGSGTTTFNGTLNVQADKGTNFGNLDITNNPNITVTQLSDIRATDLTIATGDTLITDGYEITVDDDIVITGTLNAANGTDGNTELSTSGSWDSTSGVFTSTNSTVQFNSGGAETIMSNGISFNNVIFDNAAGSWVLQDALDANENLSINNGTLDVSGNDYSINVGGDWENNGTFTERNGSVTFDGTVKQTVAHGTDDFYQVIVTNASDVVTFTEAFTTDDFIAETAGTDLDFQQGTTFTITNDLTLAGTGVNNIDINSADNSTQFIFDVTGGDQNVSDLSVSNSAASSNDIVAIDSTNSGGNDDAAASPHWIFADVTLAYLYPDVGVAGMNLALQIVGSGFRDSTIVTDDSADVILGPKIVTNAKGQVVTSGGSTLTIPFFIESTAANQTVTISVDGDAVPQTFDITTATAGDGDFTGDTGTILLGDNAADHGDRTEMGCVLLDDLIIENNLTVGIDLADPDAGTVGNQGFLPAIIIVDGDVTISGGLSVNGSNGFPGVGNAGGEGGRGGPGGGGGGGSGGDDATQGDGGDGFSGGGGGSCETDSPSCTHGNGGDGTGATGAGGSGGSGGTGGASLNTSVNGGTGGTGDTTDGSGGGGGTGFPLGASGAGGIDTPDTDGAGDQGGGGGAHNDGGGGGGFGEDGNDGASTVGTMGLSSSGYLHIVPFAGGSGGGAGGGTGSPGGGGGGGGGSLIIYATGTINLEATALITADGGHGGQGIAGGGGGGSGGAIILQSPTVNTNAAAILSAENGRGATGAQNGGDGGDGRLRVDGLPSTITSIEGVLSGNPTEFVGPGLTDLTRTGVGGTAQANATVEVYITNGVTSLTASGTVKANGTYSIPVTYVDGTNYVSVTQETNGGDVIVASPAAMGSRQKPLILGPVIVVSDLEEKNTSFA